MATQVYWLHCNRYTFCYHGQRILGKMEKDMSEKIEIKWQANGIFVDDGDGPLYGEKLQQMVDVANAAHELEQQLELMCDDVDRCLKTMGTLVNVPKMELEARLTIARELLARLKQPTPKV